MTPRPGGSFSRLQFRSKHHPNNRGFAMRQVMSKLCGHPVIVVGSAAECEAELCRGCAARAAAGMVGKTFESEPGGPLFEVRAADADFVLVESFARPGGVHRWHFSTISRMTRVA